MNFLLDLLFGPQPAMMGVPMSPPVSIPLMAPEAPMNDPQFDDFHAEFRELLEKHKIDTHLVFVMRYHESKMHPGSSSLKGEVMDLIKMLDALGGQVTKEIMEAQTEALDESKN